MITDCDLRTGLEGNPGGDPILLNRGVAFANLEQKAHGTISSPPNLPLRITALIPDWILVVYMLDVLR